VNFVYYATRALGIEHAPFEADFGFSPEEPLDLLFIMRPPILVSQDAPGRLRLLHEVRALVRSVSQLHKDDVQVRSEPSASPHLVREDKVSIVTKKSSYVGNLTRSCVIDILDLLQLRRRLGNTFTY
jgi:hypothetical protein